MYLLLRLNNFKVKKKVLFEDTVSYYNKWTQGLASREFNAQRLKFKDLFSTNHDTVTQGPNSAKAGNVLPFPLPNVVSVLGDLATNTSNAIKLLRDTIKNPALENNKKAKQELLTMLKYLKNSQAELNNIFKTIGQDS